MAAMVSAMIVAGCNVPEKTSTAQQAKDVNPAVALNATVTNAVPQVPAVKTDGIVARIVNRASGHKRVVAGAGAVALVLATVAITLAASRRRGSRTAKK